MYSVLSSHASLNAGSTVTVIASPAFRSTDALPSPLIRPVRISGPLVSSATAHSRPSSGASATLCRRLDTRPPCSSYEPCEKFIRITFMPAIRSIVSLSTASLFGPMVQTMPERRSAAGAE